MIRYVLDTNVISELVRRRPDSGVVERLRACRAGDLCTAAVCVTELRYGTLRSAAGAAIWQRLEEKILARLPVLEFGRDEALDAAEILADLARRGTPIGIEDVQIAATARVQGMTVVTRNRNHFDRVENLEVESWWTEESR